MDCIENRPPAELALFGRADARQAQRSWLMLNLKSKWIAAAAVAAIAAIPVIGQARPHYAGAVPASVLMATATTPTNGTARVRHTLSTHKHATVSTVSHKKTTAATHKKAAALTHKKTKSVKKSGKKGKKHKKSKKS